MDTADAAGAHEADPGRAAGSERAAHGRRADDALRGCCGQVARPDLARVRREASELVLVEPDADGAVEHADRRRHGAGLSDAPLALAPDADAFSGREAVRDERRLERDDRAPSVDRVRHLGGDAQEPVHSRSSMSMVSTSRPRYVWRRCPVTWKPARS